MDIDIIATVGPSLMTEAKITALLDAGATIFRINGAHATADSVRSTVADLRAFSGGRCRIMIDLPTNKVRTSNLAEPIPFEAGDRFQIHPEQLNYSELGERLHVGDEAIVNDGFNCLRVTDVTDGVIQFEADSAGKLGNNRGLILKREIHTPDFPLFFKKDLELIEVTNELNLELVGLSYLRYASDKEEALSKIEKPESIVYKIETRVAFADYERLIEPGEKILLDRGDLAGEIGLLHIPQAQDRIIRFAHRRRVEIYVATQFLGAMMHSPVPQISEVCALYETVKLGVSGIQLSEETAVGKHPLKAIKWIRDVEDLVIKEGRLEVGA